MKMKQIPFEWNKKYAIPHPNLPGTDIFELATKEEKRWFDDVEMASAVAYMLPIDEGPILLHEKTLVGHQICIRQFMNSVGSELDFYTVTSECMIWNGAKRPLYSSYIGRAEKQEITNMLTHNVTKVSLKSTGKCTTNPCSHEVAYF
jgi:hypothetical protein